MSISSVLICQRTRSSICVLLMGFVIGGAPRMYGRAAADKKQGPPLSGLRSSSTVAPGCEGMSAMTCLAESLNAMGGRARLEAIRSIDMDVVEHTQLAEQSYRQEPFITSYQRGEIFVDHQAGRSYEKWHLIWPEADLKDSESDVAVITGPEGAICQNGGHDGPCGRVSLDETQWRLALAPEVVLLSAARDPALHFLPPEELRSTPHTVVGFRWKGVPVKILINPLNHLPDAVDTVQQFSDFWYFWGDVHQRIYFDNWRYIDGIEYPSNQIIERNGYPWRSLQAINIEFNGDLSGDRLHMDPAIAARSREAKPWNLKFDPAGGKLIAPGITLFEGAWNATVVRQNDGIVIIEAPVSESYTSAILSHARELYPGTPIKAVLTTSDSWPHIAGLRYVVSRGIPVYLLGRNRSLLSRYIAARHEIAPDALTRHPRPPVWHVVDRPVDVGSGLTKAVLYPLPGPSTERQYAVYFPKAKLLYASDTLLLNSDHSLYNPELMREVEKLVDQYHLQVETVYAMHQGPTPWQRVISLLSHAA